MNPHYLHIKKTLLDLYSESEAASITKLILSKYYNFSTIELYGGKDRFFSQEEEELWQQILHRLKNNEPIQYILGQEEFLGLNFKVTSSVLIPRPETQELVDWIIRDNKELSPLRILDIGTGSGCIAISIAKLIPHSEVTAWDISVNALEIAKQNAIHNKVSITFQECDILTQTTINNTFDIIISNPPYIAQQEKEEMNSNVLEWEPHTALFVPNHDPLLFYKKIATLALDALPAGGKLYFEINEAFGKETVDLLHGLGYKNPELKKDLFGKERMIKAIR